MVRSGSGILGLSDFLLLVVYQREWVSGVMISRECGWYNFVSYIGDNAKLATPGIYSIKSPPSFRFVQ